MDKKINKINKKYTGKSKLTVIKGANSYLVGSKPNEHFTFCKFVENGTILFIPNKKYKWDDKKKEFVPI